MKIKFYEGIISLNDNMLDFATITSELRTGKPILVFDQKDREGETDIFFSTKCDIKNIIPIKASLP